MPIFQRKTQHEYIGMFSSERPAVREEVDKTLYYDTLEKTFFVVESTEIESGPRVSCDHSVKKVSEQEVLAIIASRQDLPELAEKAARFFKE